MTSEQLAWKIRRHGVEMTHMSGGSHIGTVLSAADILAVLYADVMNYRPEEPDWSGRDRLILGKGHAAIGLYAALAEEGFFPVEELKTFYANGSRLLGHASHCVPGVDFSTGSLGHGLSAGAGMAYAAKKDGADHRVYAILGDGECDEGSVWEAALFANHFGLDNLVAIVDYNHMQSLDTCENTLALEDFGLKWKAFGWNVLEIDGHDHAQLKAAFSAIKGDSHEGDGHGVESPESVGSSEGEDGHGEADIYGKTSPHKPTVIIANTVKGKGVSFMEGDILWHYRFPHDGWEYDCAVNELHRSMPEGVEDCYTPDGIPEPVLPGPDADIGNDHTMTAGWHPSYRRKSDSKIENEEPGK